MENKNKLPGSLNGIGTEDVKVVQGEGKRRAKYFDVSLRFLGLAVTLVAAILVGVSKETNVISFTVSQSFPPLHISVTAKWKYMSALVYFLVANAIACSYSAISIVALSLVPKGHEKQALLSLLLIILDSLIMGLLFSANGAALAVGLIGRDGNSHTQWMKVCYMFDKFCNRMSASITLSMIGSFLFSLLVVLAALRLHKKY